MSLEKRPEGLRWERHLLFIMQWRFCPVQELLLRFKKENARDRSGKIANKTSPWGRSPGSHNGYSRSLTSYNVEALPGLVRQIMCPHTLHAGTLYWPLPLQFSREPFLSWESDRHNLYLVLLSRKIWYWEASFKVDPSIGSCRSTVYKLEVCFETASSADWGVCSGGRIDSTSFRFT